MSSAPTRAADIDAATALRELVRREGRMATLCSEHGSLRMDWLDSVESLLADPRPLRALERAVEGWRLDGIRHVVWAGMGGSGVAVGALAGLPADGDDMAIHLLDSTDPVAIDDLVERLGEGKSLPSSGDAPAEHARALLGDVVLVAVSLGVTSEEPVTHLAWFLGLLATAGLPAAGHAMVLTVPGSRLEEAAAEADGVEARPVFLADRGGLPGRMSAPGTAVYLLPVAVRSARGGGRLEVVLADAWSAHDLAGIAEHPERSPYVDLALAIAARSLGGRSRLMLELPEPWAALHPWIEQLFEQTLGKNGKGVAVFGPQRLNTGAPGHRDDDLIVAGPEPDGALPVPVPDPSLDPHAAMAAAMLGWQVVVALLGHAAGTNIVDEPAVEDYKARARRLRDEPEVLTRAVDEGAVDWAARGADGLKPIADALVAAAGERHLSYIDVTVNGELGSRSLDAVSEPLHRLGNDLLGVPVKLRRAPAAYHISEQCQLDGPPGVVSLRMVARSTPPSELGGYTAQFLQAQAVATWQAMTARGRDCTLVVVESLEQVADVLSGAERMVVARPSGGAR